MTVGARAGSPGIGDTEGRLGGVHTKASLGMKVKSFPNPNVIQ